MMAFSFLHLCCFIMGIILICYPYHNFEGLSPDYFVEGAFKLS